VASTAQIVIEVNDAGAIQALRNVNDEVGKIGPTMAPLGHISEQTFNNIEGGALRARESAALMREELGVNIPRALRGVIAQSDMIGPAFSAAFSAVALVAFVNIAVSAGEQLAKFIDKLAGWSEQAKVTMDAQTALNNVVKNSVDDMAKLDKARQLIGLSGLDLLSKKHQMVNADLDASKKKVDDLAASWAKLTTQSQQTEKVTKLVPAGPGGSANIEVTQLTEAAKAAEAALPGVTVQLGVARAEMNKLGSESRNAGEELGAGGIAAAAAAAAKAIAELNAQAVKYSAGVEAAIKRSEGVTSAAEESLLTPFQKIDAELVKRIALIDKERVQYEFTASVLFKLEAEETAVIAEANQKRTAMIGAALGTDLTALIDKLAKEEAAQTEHARRMRAIIDQTISADREAAIASAPPWLKANMTIEADYQARIDKIKEMLDSVRPELRAQAEVAAARQSADAWTVAFSKMRDQLAGTLQSLFDDITSGNIGQRFKKMFETLVFQMVATWILGMTQMRNASAGAMGGGGGGILSTLFGFLGLGGLFGRGGAGGAGSSVGGGLLGGLGSLGAGAGSSSSSFFGGGAGDVWGGAFGAGSPGGPSAGDFGGPGGNMGDVIASAGGLSSGGAFAGLGGAVGAPGKQSGLLGLLGGAGGLAGLAGMGALSLLSMAGKAGPIGGAAIGGVAGLLGTGALIAMFPALLGIAGVFTLGIGAAIGAILGGLFGLFGGRAKQKQIDKLTADLNTQIQTIVDSYNSFGTDLPSAMSSLEALRTQYHAQIHQLGGDTNARVENPINAAEAKLQNIDVERQRRAAIQFGPAQFASGGFVGMPFASGGAVPAMLHAGEFVLQPSAVSRIGRGNLESMNAGGGGGMEVHLHFPSVYDADGFEAALNKNSGAFVRLVRRAQIEGWRG
jgi:hypothetical protein